MPRKINREKRCNFSVECTEGWENNGIRECALARRFTPCEGMWDQRRGCPMWDGGIY
jgi:hypothetical protein